MAFETLLLSIDEVRELITMKEVVEICDETFKGFGEGTTINPTKVNLDLGEAAEYPPYKGFMNAMPAYVGWQDSAGIKWAGGNIGARREMGLPYITSLILLMDPKIGNFTAVMDGAHITNFRTGAQAAVALKYLYKDKKEIKIGLFGAGMQGYTSTMAIAEVFNIRELCVYDINPDAATMFTDDLKDAVKGEIHACGSPGEVVQEDTDAIVCFTQSKEKYVKNEWFKPGMVLMPMGSYQECDNDCILSSDKIIVDHIGQTLHRGALAELNQEGKILEGHIYATIGDLAAGKAAIPDTKNEKILCIPIGTGAMDVAVATAVYKKALEEGVGGKYTFA